MNHSSIMEGTMASLNSPVSSHLVWVLFLLRFTCWFLLWTFCEYWMHRLMHVSSPYNILYRMHRSHHLTPYAVLTDKKYRWPKLSYFIFFFDNIHETLEIIVGETIPALCIYYCDPECGILLLAFHYVYEILATDSLLEHNPDISLHSVIKYCAVGQFHLEHHRLPSYNYGFTITLWDHVFKTYKYPSKTI